MPVYEYECKSCKKTMERMQRFDDPPLERCEYCGGEVKKLISNTSFVLKGNGWYITDYARKSTTTTEEQTTKGNGDQSEMPSKDNGPSGQSTQTTADNAKAEASSTVSSGAVKDE